MSLYFDQVSLAGRNFYNASESYTAEALTDESFQLCDGNSCIGGNMGLDTVAVDTLIVEGNPVPWIMWESDMDLFSDNYLGVDGVLGLGLGQLDSEFPDAQETWASWVLPQLACELLISHTFLMERRTNGNSGGIHNVLY
jgi:hypothetical protein